MGLTNLPAELLDIIIELSLPEGFENLATTCKALYARCTPFFAHHNELRSRFRVFCYGNEILAASDLIRLIAIDPMIARYIRTAKFTLDSLPTRRLSDDILASRSVPSIERGGPIVQLFAESTYLQRAELNWEDYYLVFADDVRMGRYSQHGSAFLLTLLTNVDTIHLPNSWDPNAATKQLLDLIVGETRQSPFPSSSLKSVTNLHGSYSSVTPFLTMPHLEVLVSSFFREIPTSLVFGDSPHIAENLRTIYFYSCFIDDGGITDFLKHTPALRKLRYSHLTPLDYPDQPPSWDICKFINAIAREAGSHLMELSVRIIDPSSRIVPGEASACFKSLKKFEFPLEYIVYSTTIMNTGGSILTPFLRRFNDSVDPFVRNLLPQSLTHLSLLKFFGSENNRIGGYDEALGILFRHFQVLCKFHLNNLEWLFLSRATDVEEKYNQQCKTIVAEGARIGVTVGLDRGRESRAMAW